MKILYLGPGRPNIITYLKSVGDEVYQTEEPISLHNQLLREMDFILSYGYRHIIPKDVLCLFPNRCVNLHISLLPWNRGADPNLWSFLEDTPKGVTIHLIEPGLDKGAIIVQEEVFFTREDTLRTSYQKLSAIIEDLFFKNWPQIRAGEIRAKIQPSGGSYHRLMDKKNYEHLLTQGWDTPIRQLIGKAKTNKGARSNEHDRNLS